MFRKIYDARVTPPRIDIDILAFTPQEGIWQIVRWIQRKNAFFCTHDYTVLESEISHWMEVSPPTESNPTVDFVVFNAAEIPIPTGINVLAFCSVYGSWYLGERTKNYRGEEVFYVYHFASGSSPINLYSHWMYLREEDKNEAHFTGFDKATDIEKRLNSSENKVI
ncbi:hypothetical protein [Tuwongella immobilis]|uniref:Uncharacterized protein n=1 Tax=Tuwongella immobilis TaxID=692036 RepID=A0A6C2YSL4_9BACT|nr:hypothetical protein [Tuwongella immobilis]VIP03955.1 unnamed protein product [Tuwongella immobilis]VTS05277.1 unnamed protein product [Tuwongella immobilis]